MIGTYKGLSIRGGYGLIGERDLEIAIRPVYKQGIRNERTFYTYFLIDGNKEYKLEKVKRRVIDDPNWDWEVYGWGFTKDDKKMEIEHYHDENGMLTGFEIRKVN